MDSMPNELLGDIILLALKDDDEPAYLQYHSGRKIRNIRLVSHRFAALTVQALLPSCKFSWPLEHRQGVRADCKKDPSLLRKVRSIQANVDGYTPVAGNGSGTPFDLALVSLSRSIDPLTNLHHLVLTSRKFSDKSHADAYKVGLHIGSNWADNLQKVSVRMLGWDAGMELLAAVLPYLMRNRMLQIIDFRSNSMDGEERMTFQRVLSNKPTYEQEAPDISGMDLNNLSCAMIALHKMDFFAISYHLVDLPRPIMLCEESSHFWCRLQSLHVGRESRSMLALAPLLLRTCNLSRISIDPVLLPPAEQISGPASLFTILRPVKSLRYLGIASRGYLELEGQWPILTDRRVIPSLQEIHISYTGSIGNWEQFDQVLYYLSTGIINLTIINPHVQISVEFSCDIVQVYEHHGDCSFQANYAGLWTVKDGDVDCSRMKMVLHPGALELSQQEGISCPSEAELAEHKMHFEKAIYAAVGKK